MKENHFKTGYRVVVIEGEHKGQHGKVTANNPTGLSNLQKQSQVELDNGSTVIIPDRCLQHEHLIVDVNTELTNFSNQLEKVASGLPENIQQELKTHLGYLKASLESQNKLRFDQQHNYLLAELTIGVKDRTISEELTINIRTSLNKLENWLSNSLNTN